MTLRQSLMCALLVTVGCVQMLGDLLGSAALKAVGAATTASPQPKVFTAQNGFETYSSHFDLSWLDAKGRRHDEPLTRARYARVTGPYNRRNAYGAMLSYAPVLYASPHTRPMLLSTLRYSLCDRGLHEELGVVGVGSVRGFRLRPRDATSADPRWRLDYLVDCATGALL